MLMREAAAHAGLILFFPIGMLLALAEQYVEDRVRARIERRRTDAERLVH